MNTLHRGDVIHINFWYGAGEDQGAIHDSLVDMFSRFGVTVGCSTATNSPTAFPMQFTVLSNEPRK